MTAPEKPEGLIAVGEQVRAKASHNTPPAGEENVTEDIAAFCDACAESSERHLFVGRAKAFRSAAQAIRSGLLSSPRVEEVRREALEEAAKVADEAQATAREEIAEEKAEEGYDPYAFGSGFLSGELTAAVNIAKAIRALKEKNNG